MDGVTVAAAVVTGAVDVVVDMEADMVVATNKWLTTNCAMVFSHQGIINRTIAETIGSA